MRYLLFLLAILSANVALGGETEIDTGGEGYDMGGPTFLLGFLTILALVALFVTGFGFAIGLALCAAVGALVAMGVLSTSVLVAFLHRNPASGLRALFVQLGAIAGAFVGLVCGAVAGGLFNYAWGRATARIFARLETLRRAESQAS